MAVRLLDGWEKRSAAGHFNGKVTSVGQSVRPSVLVSSLSWGSLPDLNGSVEYGCLSFVGSPV